MTRRNVTAVLVCLLLGLALAAAGCRPAPPKTSPAEEPGAVTETGVPPASEETRSTPPGEPLVVRVYFTRGEEIGVASREVDRSRPGFSAVEALVGGPVAAEKEWGLGTAIPSQTRVNGVKIAGGLATVDLSREFESGGGSLSMTLRAAQVVYTLTQIPSVKAVAFRIDGEPVDALGGEGVMVGPRVTRADFEDVTPAILVEGPTPGAVVKSPVEVFGTSNVFEANHVIEIADPDGRVISDTFVTATSGTGTRGTWKVSLPYPRTDREGMGAIIVFEESAKDGSRVNVVEIPIRMLQ